MISDGVKRVTTIIRNDKVMGQCRYFKFLFVFILGVHFLFLPAVTGADDDDKREKLKSNSAKIRRQGKSGSKPSDPVSPILNFSEELGLNNEQFAKLKATRLDYKKKNIRLTAAIKIAQLNLLNQFRSVTFDEEKMIAKSDQLGKLTVKQIKLTTNTMIKVLKELTPDQIKKVQELHLMGKKGTVFKMREGS
tara:strand:+ start:2870 stop:3445 length:576 start_codon:yes stop_codon:yes gene_type:complete